MSENDESKQIHLTSLTSVEKNELVACFSSEIKPDAHYIRHSDNPTCYLDGNDVLAIEPIEPNTELTVNFQSKTKQ